jgi:23S rRNA (adenine2503-C2)-methyltransferase
MLLVLFVLLFIVNAAAYNLAPSRHLLSLDSFDALSEQLGGSGKAKLFWEQLRLGNDPLLVPEGQGLSTKARNRCKELLEDICQYNHSNQEYVPRQEHSGSSLLTTTVIDTTRSDCGTTKLLHRCNSDGSEIESVLIPSHKFSRTTLCISTQVGCDRGCRFCATGTMGIIRNLRADEIVSQVVHGIGTNNEFDAQMPPLTNIVFMGMGDAGRNLDEVEIASQILCDRQRMQFAASKITLSTVGPDPETFQRLAGMKGTLAFSLHSADDKIRKYLVPTTKHSVLELREGLIQALLSRESIRTRTIMIACTLINGVNDGAEDAHKLAEYCQPFKDAGIKVALDLIPYNDISKSMPHLSFETSPAPNVQKFSDILREHEFFASVRMPRGDDENAACGMLARPKRLKQGNNKIGLEFQSI